MQGNAERANSALGVRMMVAILSLLCWKHSAMRIAEIIGVSLGAVIGFLKRLGRCLVVAQMKAQEDGGCSIIPGTKVSELEVDEYLIGENTKPGKGLLAIGCRQRGNT